MNMNGDFFPVSGEGPHASDNSPGETKLHLFRCALLVNVARGLVVKPAISSFEHGGHTEIGKGKGTVKAKVF